MKNKTKKYHFYKISFYPENQSSIFLGNTMALSRKDAGKKICKENNLKYSKVKDDLVIELIR